eukprot:g7335.t1
MAESSPRLAGLVVSLVLANVSASGAADTPTTTATTTTAVGSRQQHQQQRRVPSVPFLPLLASSPREVARAADEARVGSRPRRVSLLRVAELRGGVKKPAPGRKRSAAAAAWTRKGKRRARGGGGNGGGGDDSEDVEALLQSVSPADADVDNLDDMSLDFDDLAALGDFSGLGPLDFSLHGDGGRDDDGPGGGVSGFPSSEEEEGAGAGAKTGWFAKKKPGASGLKQGGERVWGAAGAEKGMRQDGRENLAGVGTDGREEKDGQREGEGSAMEHGGDGVESVGSTEADSGNARSGADAGYISGSESSAYDGGGSSGGGGDKDGLREEQQGFDQKHAEGTGIVSCQADGSSSSSGGAASAEDEEEETNTTDEDESSSSPLSPSPEGDAATEESGPGDDMSLGDEGDSSDTAVEEVAELEKEESDEWATDGDSWAETAVSDGDGDDGDGDGDGDGESMGLGSGNYGAGSSGSGSGSGSDSGSDSDGGEEAGDAEDQTTATPSEAVVQDDDHDDSVRAAASEAGAERERQPGEDALEAMGQDSGDALSVGEGEAIGGSDGDGGNSEQEEARADGEAAQSSGYTSEISEMSGVTAAQDATPDDNDQKDEERQEYGEGQGEGDSVEMPRGGDTERSEGYDDNDDNDDDKSDDNDDGDRVEEGLQQQQLQSDDAMTGDSETDTGETQESHEGDTSDTAESESLSSSGGSWSGDDFAGDRQQTDGVSDTAATEDDGNADESDPGPDDDDDGDDDNTAESDSDSDDDDDAVLSDAHEGSAVESADDDDGGGGGEAGGSESETDADTDPEEAAASETGSETVEEMEAEEADEEGWAAETGVEAEQPGVERGEQAEVDTEAEGKAESEAAERTEAVAGAGTGVGMDEWLESHARDPVPAAGAPPRRTLDQLLEDGLDESDDEDEPETAGKLQEHRDLARRWVSSATDAAGAQRTKKQLLKIAMLGYSRSVIAGAGGPGASPGRERLALAGLGAAGLAGLVFRLLDRRIQDADYGNAPDVEVEAVSALGFVLGKKAAVRRVSARGHDLACLRSAATWGFVLVGLGMVLSVALKAGDPLFILSALVLSRFLAEPVFFVHAMGGGGVASARRPFVPPSLVNALLGAPHGLAPLPPSSSDGDEGGGEGEG